MFYLRKKFRFEAAHRLAFHDGKCARLHGHSWNGALVVAGPSVQTAGPKDNMLMDYGDISAVINPLVDRYLDHHFLNETLGMASPTSETICVWLWCKVEKAINNYGHGVRLIAVTIEETCTSSCTFTGGYALDVKAVEEMTHV